MPQLRTNLIANLTGAVWNAALSLLLIPVYIGLLGVEAWALVGLHLTLQAIFFVLDMGLSTTLNREIARLAHDPDRRRDLGDLVFTLQVLYWMIAAAVAAIVYVGAAPLAGRWLNSVQLAPDTVVTTIRLIGVVIALQFPFAFYTGGLLGLQRHVAVNVIAVVWATVRAVGAVTLLWLVSPSIALYFAWQVAATAGQVITTGLTLRRSLPRGDRRPQFSIGAVRRVARFAAGLGATTILGTLLSHSDKIVLSRVLTLEAFGYYTIATSVASFLLLAVGPVFTSVLPRFSQLVASRDDAELRTAYHRSAQSVAMLVVPAAVMLAFFSREALLIWTGNEAIAANAWLVTSLLTVGFALGALNHVPYALQLAEGWVGLPLGQNLAAAALLVPATVWAGLRYGAAGAAVVWVIVNFSYIVVGVGLMHTRFLRGDASRWYLRGVLLPLTGALAVALPVRLWLPSQLTRGATFLVLAITGVAALSAAALLTPYMREVAGEVLAAARARRLTQDASSDR